MAQGQRSSRAEALATRDTDHPFGVPVLFGSLLATGYGLIKFGAPNYEITTLNAVEIITVGAIVAILTYLLQQPRAETNPLHA